MIQSVRALIKQTSLSKLSIARGAGVTKTTMHNVCYSDNANPRLSTVQGIVTYIAENDPSAKSPFIDLVRALKEQETEL